MNTIHTDRPQRRLEDVFHSDRLPRLMAFIEEMPLLAELLPRLPQVRLVADANRIHAELRWRLRKRRDPIDRSAIHEAIEAGVAVFLAPQYLKPEIEKHY